MCSKVVVSMVLVLICCSCAVKRQMTQVLTGELKADIAIPQMEVPVLSYEDSSDDTVLTTSAVMNAMKDSVTGEMVATDVLRASKVVARFRHAAERRGVVMIEFDLCVPSDMIVSKWKLGFYPKLSMNDDSCDLAPVFVTGEEYRGKQLRGYERYRKFIDSIITDDAAFIRQDNLEIFIRRHFPLTYRMKTDSSFVTGSHEENLFGVTVSEAVEHYKRHLLIRRNQKKINDRDKVFRTLVKDPVGRSDVRLDTVLTTLDGDFIYRYQQEMAYRPMLKKIILDTDVRLFEDGEVLARLKSPQSLTYYISSLSSLVDKRMKYRKVHDSLVVDTVYMRGVDLVEKADYKAALKILRPYNDYNSALALLLSGYDEAALTCLNNIQSIADGGQVGLSANLYYLMAVLYSRLGDNYNAIRSYKASVEINPALVHRANLDPEVYELIHNENKDNF